MTNEIKFTYRIKGDNSINELLFNFRADRLYKTIAGSFQSQQKSITLTPSHTGRIEKIMREWGYAELRPILELLEKNHTVTIGLK